MINRSQNAFPNGAYVGVVALTDVATITPDCASEPLRRADGDRVMCFLPGAALMNKAVAVPSSIPFVASSNFDERANVSTGAWRASAPAGIATGDVLLRLRSYDLGGLRCG